MAVTVGAFRWDFWYPVPPVLPYPAFYYPNKALNPAKWHYRLPFWGTELGTDSVDVTTGSEMSTMLKEIDIARAMGIDYWIFFWNRNPQNQENAAKAFNNYQSLTSKQRRGVKFCMVLQMAQTGNSSQWNTICDELVVLMQSPDYMTVLSGRPLLFFYNVNPGLDNFFGSTAAAQAGITTLKNKISAAGLPAAYIASTSGMTGVYTYGMNAAADYGTWFDTTPTERPFENLTALAKAKWNSYKASSYQIIPGCTVGWDVRPHTDNNWANDAPWGYGAPTGWNTHATPTQCATHIQEAIDFVNANPSNCVAKTVTIYAWNEIGEGGWLVPHKGDGGGRTVALGKQVKKQREPGGRSIYRQRGINFDSR